MQSCSSASRDVGKCRAASHHCDCFPLANESFLITREQAILINIQLKN